VCGPGPPQLTQCTDTAKSIVRHRPPDILFCLKQPFTVLLPMRSVIDAVLVVAAVLAIYYEFMRR
jgi:hypothetical protein